MLLPMQLSRQSPLSQRVPIHAHGLGVGFDGRFLGSERLRGERKHIRVAVTHGRDAKHL